MTRMELDVTKNINIIETLKSRLLDDVSLLYANMLKLPSDSQERTEILADISLTAYLLSNRLGQGPAVLDEKMIQQLRLGVLEESNPLYSDQIAVLRHIKGIHSSPM